MALFRSTLSALFVCYVLLFVILAGCKSKVDISTGTGGDFDGDGGQAWSNLGYGADSVLLSGGDGLAYAQTIRSFGLMMMVMELYPQDRSIPLSTVIAHLRSYRQAGLALILVHAVNLNCKSCPSPSDVAGMVSEIARQVGTSGIVMEVAEPWVNPSAASAYMSMISAAWPGLMTERDVRELHRCSTSPETGGPTGGGTEGPWPTGRGILFVTDCWDSGITNAGGIAAWAKRTGERVIIYDISATSANVSVLTQMREALP